MTCNKVLHSKFRARHQFMDNNAKETVFNTAGYTTEHLIRENQAEVKDKKLIVKSQLQTTNMSSSAAKSFPTCACQCGSKCAGTCKCRCKPVRGKPQQCSCSRDCCTIAPTRPAP